MEADNFTQSVKHWIHINMTQILRVFKKKGSSNNFILKQ